MRIRAGLTLARTFANTVYGKVFCRSSNTIVLLQSLDHFDAETRHEIGIFSIDIFQATPALISSHVKCWGIDVCVTQRAGFGAGDAPHLTHEFLVPRVSDTQLRRKTCGNGSGNATQALVSKVDWNTQPGFFDEETLCLVHGPHVLLEVFSVDAIRPRPPPIQVLIDVGNAIFPNPILPGRSGQFVF